MVVVLEEVEGLARRRGGPDSAAYDRILATLLQRLDDPCDDLGRLPLVLISTSNRPDLIDSAMLRRLGLRARFTRLDRDGLTAVLDKKLKPDYPYEAEDGQTPDHRDVVPAKGQDRLDSLAELVLALAQRFELALDGGFAARHCVVLDISRSGAKICLDEAAALPARLRLAFSRDARTGRECQVVWRRGKTAGVKFVR